MTADEQEKKERQLINVEIQRLDREGVKIDMTADEMYELTKKLEKNMSDFMQSAMGEGTKDFVSTYQEITDILDNIIEKKMPTHESAANMKASLTNMAESLSYIAAVTGGADEKTKSVVSGLFRDMAIIKNGIIQYAALVETLNELQPELTKELKKPEYENKDINTLYQEHLDAMKSPKYNPAETPSLLDIAVDAARARRTAAQKLPTLNSTGSPDQLVMTNTALESALLAIDGKGELIGAGAQDIITSHKKKNRSETTIYAMASLENMQGVRLEGKAWGLYDQAVHWAVCSIVEDRLAQGLAPMATPDMVYRFLAGLSEQEYVSDQSREETRNSIEKQRNNIKVYADITDDVRNYHPDLIQANEEGRVEIDDFILASRRITVKSGGKKVEAYIFNRPMLLEYAKLTNKVLRQPAAILQIKEINQKTGRPIPGSQIANTKTRIMIKDYLLRRLIQYKGDMDSYRKAVAAEDKRKRRAAKSKSEYIPMPPKEPHSNIILLETLYAAIEAGEHEENDNKNTIRNRRSSCRKYVLQVLDYWKAEGFLQDYKIRHKGRAIDAIILQI